MSTISCTQWGEKTSTGIPSAPCAATTQPSRSKGGSSCQTCEATPWCAVYGVHRSPLLLHLLLLRSSRSSSTHTRSHVPQPHLHTPHTYCHHCPYFCSPRCHHCCVSVFVFFRPIDVSDSGVCAVGNQIYVVGGCRQGNDQEQRVSRFVLRYDTRTLTWHWLPDMPVGSWRSGTYGIHCAALHRVVCAAAAAQCGAGVRRGCTVHAARWCPSID